MSDTSSGRVTITLGRSGQVLFLRILMFDIYLKSFNFLLFVFLEVLIVTFAVLNFYELDQFKLVYS